MARPRVWCDRLGARHHFRSGVLGTERAPRDRVRDRSRARGRRATLQRRTRDRRGPQAGRLGGLPIRQRLATHARSLRANLGYVARGEFARASAGSPTDLDVHSRVLFDVPKQCDRRARDRVDPRHLRFGRALFVAVEGDQSVVVCERRDECHVADDALSRIRARLAQSLSRRIDRLHLA